MARRNPKAGRGPCPHCGEAVFFRSTASQKLTFDCEACDSSGFAEPGGKCFKAWASRMTPMDGKATPGPAPSPAPAAPAARSVFSLGQLG